MLDTQNRLKLLDQLMRQEGRKLNAQGRHIPYRCAAGALTIGYGHNLDASPVPGIDLVNGLSEDQARRLLIADLAAVEDAVLRAFPWFQNLDGVRYAVLLNMAFNLGVRGLAGFKNTLASIERGDYADAARRMRQSKWAGQVGHRATELAEQMESGAWQR